MTDCLVKEKPTSFLQTLPKRELRNGYIYIIGNYDGSYKIGLSIKPIQRIFQCLSPDLPHSPKIVLIFQVDDMYLEEGRLHSKYDDKKTRMDHLPSPTEWFLLSQDDLAEILNKYENESMNLKNPIKPRKIKKSGSDFFIERPPG